MVETHSKDDYLVIITNAADNEKFKLKINNTDDLETLKNLIEETLKISFESDHDLYLTNFHLSSAFDSFIVKNLFENFNSDDLILEKRINKITQGFDSSNKEPKSNIVKINALNNFKILTSENKVKAVCIEEEDLVTKQNELLNTYNELIYQENELKIYYKDISINFSIDDSNDNIKNFRNDYSSIDEEYNRLNKKNNEINAELKFYEEKFDIRTEQLLNCKLKEKKAFNIIKKNELISNDITLLQSNFEKIREKRDNVLVKEEKLFNKLKKETKLNESLIKKNSELMVYLRKLGYYYYIIYQFYFSAILFIK